MTQGRKKRITTYMNKAKKATKNLGTRRTTIARTYGDLRKANNQNSNKRLKPK